METLLYGNALTELQHLPSESVDAICCDPPSGISFMSKKWDADKGGRTQWIAWLAEIMTESLRVLKPGGHAVVWALPRTSHWTACALEDAGFEMRDCLYHFFGSGFPKSHNVSKSINKLSGIEAQQYDGYGTALKPGVECWWLCRKPLEKGMSIAENVLKWGTGGLNIDACRVGSESTIRQNHAPRFDGLHYNNGQTYDRGDYQSGSTQGRWPAHLLLSHALFCTETCTDDCPVKALNEQSGQSKSVNTLLHHKTMGYGGNSQDFETSGYEDQGGASRYFMTFRYTPKASRRERDTGCTKNTHPTVKPVTLMSWLLRLITPPGGIVLDMFMGSGTTGVAALLEGMNFIGIEQEEEYFSLAQLRLSSTQSSLFATK